MIPKIMCSGCDITTEKDYSRKINSKYYCYRCFSEIKGDSLNSNNRDNKPSHKAGTPQKHY